MRAHDVPQEFREHLEDVVWAAPRFLAALRDFAVQVFRGARARQILVEAAAEIARQIRLRNLSGKIIIDFAGSSDYHFLKPVIEALEKEVAQDYTRTTVLGSSRAGNVEVIRVRRRPTLQDLLTVECESCQGTGRVMR